MNNERMKSQWFLHLSQKNLSDSTIANYRKHLKSLDKYLKNKSYSEMTIEGFQDFFTSRKIAATSKNVLSAVLMEFYEYLYDRGHTAENMRKYLPKVKVVRTVKENVPTVQEVKKIIMFPDINGKRGYRDRTMMIVQYSGGLRCAELLGMDLDDIDIIRQTIFITRKGGHTQEIPIGSVAMEYLVSYINEVRPLFEPKGDFLWVNDWKDRVKECAYRSKVKKYWRTFGIENYSTHSFRHGTATHMHNNGAPLHAISYFLGHKSIESTAIYTKVNPTEVRDVIDDIELKDEEGNDTGY